MINPYRNQCRNCKHKIQIPDESFLVDSYDYYCDAITFNDGNERIYEMCPIDGYLHDIGKCPNFENA